MSNTNELYEMVDSWDLDEFIDRIEEAGSLNKLSRELGLTRSVMQSKLNKLKESNKEEIQEYTAKILHDPQWISIPKDGPSYFILTSAQDGTEVHEDFLTNLEAYAEYLGARIMVAGFTYNKRLFENHDASSPQTFYHPRVQKYLDARRHHIGPGIDFCCEQNTLPTAVRPLTGFETYTENRWGVFPHAKVQLQSIPTSKKSPPKIIMTTGAVTLTNYVAKRAGRRAEFHHSYGAVLVTLYPDGEFTCRHLLGENDDGSFYDLNHYVNSGKVVELDRGAYAVQWGDIHHEQIDPMVEHVAFAPDTGILDVLKPEFQFFHDTIDFRVRNHHNVNDPIWRFKLYMEGEKSVESTMLEASDFLYRLEREWCRNIVVESNHDKAFEKWLKEADYRRDPPNAIFFLDSQKRLYEAIARGEYEIFSIFEDTMRKYKTLDRTEFLKEDDQFVILGEIECAMHGHLGANGSKASPQQFTKMGMKANTGHTHSCSIYDGIYTAGTFSKLDLGYNKGLSSWSHSMIVTYPNAKRAIITITPKGKWR